MKATQPAAHPNIVALLPLFQSVVELLNPYAEGAVHDLQAGRVIALYNNYSKRKVGDPSPLHELGVAIKDFPDTFAPYYKTNWDGRKLKCISVTVRDDSGAPIGLLCLNFDTSAFQHMNIEIEKFLSLPNKSSLNPVEQFSSNWQEQVATFITTFARQQNISIAAASKEQKSELVHNLYKHGLFNYRDAAVYVAKELGVSRTTIYNYLREIK